MPSKTSKSASISPTDLRKPASKKVRSIGKSTEETTNPNDITEKTIKKSKQDVTIAAMTTAIAKTTSNKKSNKKKTINNDSKVEKSNSPVNKEAEAETTTTPVPLTRLDENQVKKAVKALFAFEKKRKESANEGKQKLLDMNETNPVFLILSTKKISEKLKAKPERIPLKNAIMDKDTSEVCVITKDPQRKYKDLFQEKEIKVSKIMGVSKLKERFKAFEAKRQLCGSYDFFMADERVLPLLPKLLGKTFFEKKRLPVPINLQKESKINKEFDEIMTSTFIHFNKGSCITIRIGLLSHKPEQVIENIMDSIDRIISKVPQNWKNIQSIHLKSTASIALPVYNSFHSSTNAQGDKTNVNDEQNKQSSNKRVLKPENQEEDSLQSKMDEQDQKEKQDQKHMKKKNKVMKVENQKDTKTDIKKPVQRLKKVKGSVVSRKN